jgi:hypothetical protein
MVQEFPEEIVVPEISNKFPNFIILNVYYRSDNTHEDQGEV